MIQDDLRRDEWSVDSWTAGDRYGTSCAQLDNFDWVMPAGYPVSVCPNWGRAIVCQTFTQMSVMFRTCFRFVRRWRLWKMAAVEPLCFHVVVPTRSQGGGGCDSVLSRYRGGGGGG